MITLETSGLYFSFGDDQTFQLKRIKTGILLLTSLHFFFQYVLNETSNLFASLQAQNVETDTVNVMLATQQIEKFAINYAKTHLQNSTKPTTLAEKQLGESVLFFIK